MLKKIEEMKTKSDRAVKANVGIVRYQFNDQSGSPLGITELRFPDEISAYNVPSVGATQQFFDAESDGSFVEYFGTVDSVSFYTAFDSSKNLSQTIIIVCKDSRIVRTG